MPRKPSLIGDQSGEVGFLDAPGLSSDRLVDWISDAFEALDAGAVLSVHSDAPDVPDAVDTWCRAGGHELLGVVNLDGGGVSMVMRKGTDHKPTG